MTAHTDPVGSVNNTDLDSFQALPVYSEATTGVSCTLVWFALLKLN